MNTNKFYEHNIIDASSQDFITIVLLCNANSE